MTRSRTNLLTLQQNPNTISYDFVENKKNENFPGRGKLRIVDDI